MDGEMALLATLPYDTGKRLLKGLRLRIKDLDCAQQATMVRKGKGGKDWVAVLPRSLQEAIWARKLRKPGL